jgi:hypothetical protein
MRHAAWVEAQPEIISDYAESFEACVALDDYARNHRPVESSSQTPVHTWTLARSARTYKVVVQLCRLGYGQQASMLNRTLFEDMIYTHWAAKFPRRSNKLMRWHEEYVKLWRIKLYERHNIPHQMTPPPWSGKRRKRMAKLFRRGTWTGRSVPAMVNAVEEMWPEGRDRDRLHRMHDILHQGLNTLMHHSARSLSAGVEINDQGATGFHLGPSRDLVPLALGFAFWTYANTISVTLNDDDLTELSNLVSRYDHVIPDRSLEAMMVEALGEQ